MLATFRCDEIIRGINEKMADHVKQLQTSVCCSHTYTSRAYVLIIICAPLYLIGIWWISKGIRIANDIIIS